MKFVSVLAITTISLIAGLALVLTTEVRHHRPLEREDQAMEMFDWWYSQRAYPYDYIPAGAFQKAVAAAKIASAKRRAFSADAVTPGWVSLGPSNIGGRILAIAVNPASPSTVWAGSASGGLWKSTTGGAGSNGWSYVNTGFNTLSVSAIALSPADPTLMLIGTGELSFYHSGLVGTPGARSSYGIGILRSSDGGSTWATTNLTWLIPQATAVQKIIFNPQNANTVYAATSEGIYKSLDGGQNWSLSSNVLMAMDIAMNPGDTTIVYAAHGNLNSTVNPGLYRTTNAGAGWSLMAGGLPTTNFGRTALAVSPASPSVVFAGVSNGDPNGGGILGVYKSTDNGVSWAQMSTTNYTSSQGWYDNVIASNPAFADSLYCSGLDIYRSANGGTTLTRVSDWTAGFLGTISPGGSEGSATYAHADHHAITFDPVNRKTMYFGTDGGIFKSTDGGTVFFGINGGLVTTQFYNGFANAIGDSTIALGGLQDNGVVKYQGTTAWRKVDGGDGGWNAIDSTNSAILYDEYTYLTLSKSTNGGGSFFGIGTGLASGSANANFIAPFTISHSSPNVLYAGARDVYKSTNGGLNWFATNSGANLNGTKIASIAVSFTSKDTVLAATGTSSSASPVFQVFASTDGGTTWGNVTGSLPSRYPSDLEFDPNSSTTAYVTYSGYGTSHVFRTTNLGQSWSDITTGVDVPHQSVTIDPDDPASIYVGTDLGVYHTSDYGATWEQFNTGMNPSMVLDVSISYANRTIRAATFGSGVYERKLVHFPHVAVTYPNGGEIFTTAEMANLTWSEKFVASVNIDYSLDGGATWTPIAAGIPATSQPYVWTIPDTTTSDGLLRVSDASSGSTNDVSDAPFSIVRNADVATGWNLLSLYLHPSDPLTADLFPTASSHAFTYFSGYAIADSLATGVAFWLKFNAPEQMSFAGDSLLAETLAVQAGWNMIGGLSVPVDVAAVASSPDSIISSQFFGYKGGYSIADTIAPKKGYWVKTTSAGSLILASAGGTIPARQLRADTLATIVFVDAAGRTQTLGLTRDQAAIGRSALPPPPPSSAFDIRFASGNALAGVSDNQGPRRQLDVALQGVKFPLTIRCSARAQTGSLTVPSAASGAAGVFVVDHPTDRLAVAFAPTSSGGDVPVSYRLEQNYPNPFNPSTTIRYALPVDALVILQIVSMDGQTVATLRPGIQSAGSHEINFNAAGYASGIYFARLLIQDASTPGRSRTVGTVKMALVR